MEPTSTSDAATSPPTAARAVLVRRSAWRSQRLGATRSCAFVGTTAGNSGDRALGKAFRTTNAAPEPWLYAEDRDGHLRLFLFSDRDAYRRYRDARAPPASRPSSPRRACRSSPATSARSRRSTSTRSPPTAHPRRDLYRRLNVVADAVRVERALVQPFPRRLDPRRQPVLLRAALPGLPRGRARGRRGPDLRPRARPAQPAAGGGVHPQRLLRGLRPRGRRVDLQARHPLGRAALPSCSTRASTGSCSTAAGRCRRWRSPAFARLVLEAR